MKSKLLNWYLQLDKLLIARGLACLVVVIGHYAPGDLLIKGVPLAYFLGFDGPGGVSIFFVLSGYLMSKAFYTNRYALNLAGIKNFFISRAKRILPLYYFVTFISIVFVYPHLFRTENLKALASILLFFYHYTSFPVQFNISYWTMSVEVQYYLLVPVIMFFLLKLRDKPRAALATLSTLILYGMCRILWFNQSFGFLDWFYKFPITWNIEIFLYGMLIYPILIGFPKVRVFLSKYGFISVIVLFGIFGMGLYNNVSKGLLYQDKRMLPAAILAILFVYLVETTDIDKKIEKTKFTFSRVFKSPSLILTYLGTISYGMYLWHLTIIEKISPTFTYPQEPLSSKRYLFLLVFQVALTIIFASVTYYIVEVPAQKWLTLKSKNTT